MAFDNIIPVGKGHFSREWECFVFYTAKRQIPLDAVLHRFRSRPLDFLSFSVHNCDFNTSVFYSSCFRLIAGYRLCGSLTLSEHMILIAYSQFYKVRSNCFCPVFAEFLLRLYCSPLCAVAGNQKIICELFENLTKLFNLFLF